MKQMISRLIKRKEAEIVESLQRNKSSTIDWLPCQHVYYLFDTLKLQYESENGLITAERVSTQNVEKVFEAMTSSPSLTPKYTAGIPSLCSMLYFNVWGKLGRKPIWKESARDSRGCCVSL